MGGSLVRSVLYAGDYECVTEGGNSRHYYYLDGGVIYVKDSSGSHFYYSSTDHLGSITHIYDEAGTEVFAASYDAWGCQTVTTNTLNFHRGYTGHEMLPEFGLINMNGRLYDPILGRFLSPDNYVQLPDFSQSFNRYSYCLNNPSKYTDSSGELFGIDDLIVSSFSFVFGYVSNAISTGNWGWTSVRSGLISAGNALIGYNAAGLFTGQSSNMWNFIGQTGINTAVNSVFPSMYFPISNHFGISVSPAFAFGEGGFSAGLNMSKIYHNGDFKISSTIGIGSNFYGWFDEIGIGDFHAGFGLTHYDSNSVNNSDIGSQTVGTGKLGYGNVSFTLSNDLFGEKHQDRWRTSAAELSIGRFSIGTYVITNDGQHESVGSPDMTRPSLLLGPNKAKGAHTNGQVYFAPAWIGYRYNGQITRIGYSYKYVQVLTQNAVHHYFKPGAAPDFTYYDSFVKGLYTYSGYDNPLSIWNR